EMYLLAGYPWFKVRARDQFVSLPGCTLSVGRPDDFTKIMDSAIPHIQDFLNDKPRKNIIKQIDDPDVLLWVTWALQQYWKENKPVFKEKYVDFLFSIINFILSNKHPNLTVDPENGLVSTYGRDVAVSWMNAVQNGKPVTPRSGYLVEFNALWHNALKFAEEVAAATNKEVLATTYEEKALKAQQSFIETFLNDAGYLYDYVDGTYADRNVRPNMIFAVSMDYSPLDRRQKKLVIDFVTKELLTPVGIRSLSPKGYNYRPRYAGTSEEKEYAYFNGCAFPWLIGAYIEAYLKVFSMSGLSLADRVMIELEDQMQNDCIGTLSEFYDSSPPFYAHGGYSFAMSVSETLRAKRLIRSFG
ncbi:MAG TPA: 4-alpha-glucanotransferase, partial [Porphyromonadaceae bacterium]|nr:4-alpha-glucanotransferase [Porphyromonadaceae bacterium]